MRLTWINDRIKRRNNQPGSQDRNKNDELKNGDNVGTNSANYNGYNKGDCPSAQSYSQSNGCIFLLIQSLNSPISIGITNNNNTATRILTIVLFLSLPVHHFCPPGIWGAVIGMSY